MKLLIMSSCMPNHNKAVWYSSRPYMMQKELSLWCVTAA